MTANKLYKQTMSFTTSSAQNQRLSQGNRPKKINKKLFAYSCHQMICFSNNNQN